MAAPNTRTGFTQASIALRKFGMRPCKIEKAPGLSSSAGTWKFAAIRLQRGKTDQTITLEDVEHYADTLTDLVYKVTLVEGGNNQLVHNEVVPAPAEIDPKMAAIQTLLDSSAPVDPETIRQMVRDCAGYEITTAREMVTEQVNKLLEACKADVDTLNGKIETAIESATSAIPKTIQIQFPDRDPVNVEGAHEMFPTLVEEMGLGLSVMIKGPSGSGKTHGIIEACKALGRPYHLMRAVMDPFELLGFVDAGGTYQPTPVYLWANDPGSVLIMDEVDRSNPKAVIALNTAWNAEIPFPTGTVKVPAENLIVATANTWGQGADAEYVGSARLDAATLNRFPTRLDWQYDVGLEQRLSGNPAEAQWCQGLRARLAERGLRVIFGPRDIIAHCRRVDSGTSRLGSLKRSVLATIEADTLLELVS